MVAKKFPEHPKNPERICWGCDRYCPANDMACGNGSDRTQHPVELFGDDWLSWDPIPTNATATVGSLAPAPVNDQEADTPGSRRRNMP